jgi:aspartate-semialdehyde dehydrogenase
MRNIEKRGLQMKKTAIIGYHNTLSQNILELLALRGYTTADVAVFAPGIQGENRLSFGDNELVVLPLEKMIANEFESAVFCGFAEDAARYARKLAAQGLKIVNATSALEGEADIPMVVGGINDEALAQNTSNIINVPAPYVVQLLGALAGLKPHYTFKTIRLSAYVAADSEGQDGMSELYNRTRRILMNDMSASENSVFHKTLAFNVVPQVGSFIGEETSAEWLYNTQLKQVLGGDIKAHANAALISAFVGAGQFVNLETVEDMDADEAREYLKQAKGVLVVDRQEDGGYASLTDAQGESRIFVSRVRQDVTVENGISLWIAGDSYKVAAQNILALLKRFLKKGDQ